MESRKDKFVGGNRYSGPRTPKEDKTEMIFGSRPILEAFSAGKELEKIFLLRGSRNPTTDEIVAEAKRFEVPVVMVPAEKLDRLTRKNHQGAVAFISPITYQPLNEIITSLFEQGKNPLVLILDRITDVRNFGSIARNAECMGVDAIVIPSRGGAQINADAMKTSAGALNLVPVCREPNLKDTMDYLKEYGFQLVACTEKTEHQLNDFAVDMVGPTAIIMGSEEDGISPEYLKRADVKLRIPLMGQIGSLNVSVATGIVLYEVMRQRLRDGGYASLGSLDPR
ncbi:23S rRNA (guanosine(2251)-2'-O)-methyltransferase RlmB [Pontibacter akesuensis]|uniref:23S rRNA (Guanosine2251-2'-O)-methyltransferase n=1 Tax=Pontibacter akesuensis TaxID=388950 RepID=A0A1I7JDP5_9BACT|nr:23S rRNA (guanosine(2251)-2'-O)-methyltransferase RlmB [Pontibacter akesuensis]GHA70728.1 23S rRNA (guanosine(2251)-2'-O)-methyltransferase RlmB [Pontibacter akesuensis]SFU83243.1 23S rRNA (guanosine2251-2'-O)-methyltransferase [Pontibacter akesuensis]